MSSTGAGYDQSVSTYSPDGRLYQVEYAYKAVEASGTVVGVRCRDGVVLAAEKLLTARMLVPTSGRRVAAVAEHAGVATAGLMPDARALVTRAREEAAAYKENFGESVPPSVLAERLGAFTHAYTVYWAARPFGVSTVLAGYDREKRSAEVYLVEPNGACLRHVAAAVGKGARAAKSEAEKGRIWDKTVEEALGPIAKIIHGVRDDSKDKPFELEIGVLSEATGWRFVNLSSERVAAASAWARAAIEAEEMGEDEE